MSSIHDLHNIANYLGKRLVPCYLFAMNQGEMMRWQMNCCRQTAFLVRHFVEELFGLPGQLWEGIFEDPHIGEYDHAWVYIPEDVIPSGLVIDTARVTLPVIIAPGINDPARYINQLELERQHVDHEPLYEELEYYTGRPYRYLVQDIHDMMLRSGLIPWRFSQRVSRNLLSVVS
jgi:hypothetical protein